MNDYISREADFDAVRKAHNPNTARAVMSVVALREVPAADVVKKEAYDSLLENALIMSAALRKYEKADVVEVVHGEWIVQTGSYDSRETWIKCSVCNYPTTKSWGETKFCPKCGAKMDGGDHDAAD